MLFFDKVGQDESAGTSLQGHILASYDKLHALFGIPTMCNSDPDEKVQCQWVFKVCDGENKRVITLYNWKTGTVPTEPYKWHVGGRHYDDAVIMADLYRQASERVVS